MYIVAIAWIYVVLMMSITEESIIAGLMTFALYGILPLTIILYIMGSPQRKRQRKAREVAARLEHTATIASTDGKSATGGTASPTLLDVTHPSQSETTPRDNGVNT